MTDPDTAYFKEQIEGIDARIRWYDALIQSEKERSLVGHSEEWKATHRRWIGEMVDTQDMMRARRRVLERWVREGEEENKLMQGESRNEKRIVCESVHSYLFCK